MLLLFLHAQLRKTDELMILILFFFFRFSVPKRNWKCFRFKGRVFIQISFRSLNSVR